MTKNTDNSPDNRAALRADVARRVLAGEKPARLARKINVHRSTIYQWLNLYKRLGSVGLGDKRSPGQSHKAATIKKSPVWRRLPNRSPADFDTTGNLWTPTTFQHVIEQALGMRLAKFALSGFLSGELGISRQRPITRLTVQNAPHLKQWIAREYPLIQRQAKKNGALIYFISKTQGAGCTSLTATTPRGEPHFLLYEQDINPTDKNAFLEKLYQDNSRPFFLIVDHSCKNLFKQDTKAAQRSANRPWTLFFLPENGPEKQTCRPPEIVQRAMVQTLPKNRCDTAFTPPSALDSLIRTLYQSVWDLPLFATFCIEMRKHFDAINTLIFIGLGRPQAILDPVTHIHEASQYLYDHSDWLFAYWHANPLLIKPVKTGDIFCLSEVIDADALENNLYYQKLIKPAGIVDQLALCFQGPGDLLCLIHVDRTANRRPFNRQDKELLQALGGHLEIATATAVHMRHRLYALHALEQATDNLDFAAFIVDGNGKVVEYSRGAKKLLQQRPDISLQDKKLVFPGRGYQKKLQHAVDRAIDWRWTLEGSRPVEALRFNYPNKSDLGILVQAIEPQVANIPATSAFNPHLIIFVNDLNRKKSVYDQRLLASLFQLSERELQLTTQLTQGQSLQEAANNMNITISSARTYLQHIYEKVGVHRQKDLVQKISTSIALLGVRR